jgi:colanic acid/amylovoran biosynthesis glycosyltransferase
VIDGKIATIFHGIDISSREVLNHYTPEYQQLFRRGDMMLPISELWAGRLKSMGCPGRKSPFRAWALIWRVLPCVR